MIKSKADLKHYLREDRIQLNKKRIRPRLIGDEVWVYQILLRKEEYYQNTNKKFRAFLYKVRRHRLGLKLGFTIPINVFGSGLSIAHYGTIIVNPYCRIGKNCRLHACVNIGTRAGESGAAPEIGDNAYIGPGAKIIGPIKLGNNIAVGANAVVNKSFPDGDCTIAGVPARILSLKGSKDLWLKSHELEKLRGVR